MRCYPKILSPARYPKKLKDRKKIKKTSKLNPLIQIKHKRRN